MRSNVEWTEELDAVLVGLVASGAPYTAIGSELGVTPFSARYRAVKLGIAPKRCFKWSDEHEIKMLKYLAAGETLANISKKLGVGEGTLRARAAKLGIVATKIGSVYPLSTIPRRFIKVGLECIARWAERGWLPEPTRVKTKTPGRYLYRYTRKQLEAFLEVEEAWVSWRPDDLIDADLREYARERREGAGWYWMSSAEVAARLGYAHGSDVIRRWASESLEWRGKLFIKSTHLAAIERAMKANPWIRGTLGDKYREPLKDMAITLAGSQIAFLEQRYDSVAVGVRALVDAAMAEGKRE